MKIHEIIRCRYFWQFFKKPLILELRRDRHRGLRLVESWIFHNNDLIFKRKLTFNTFLLFVSNRSKMKFLSNCLHYYECVTSVTSVKFIITIEIFSAYMSRVTNRWLIHKLCVTGIIMILSRVVHLPVVHNSWINLRFVQRLRIE